MVALNIYTALFSQSWNWFRNRKSDSGNCNQCLVCWNWNMSRNHMMLDLESESESKILGKCWYQNHLLLESELVPKSRILVNPGIRITCSWNHNRKNLYPGIRQVWESQSIPMHIHIGGISFHRNQNWNQHYWNQGYRNHLQLWFVTIGS